MSSTKPKCYFLIDCNQFFVACEQVFNPRLLNRPVVVLSNNDGCVISRSKEAKLLGIPMGAPAYQVADLFTRHTVQVLSSNFSLYGDMSQRVMDTLSLFSDDMEEYSIDEAFLKLECADPLALAQDIKNTVLQHTGIAVSVGIGPTKTLSKVANDVAKKNLFLKGVCALLDPSDIDHTLRDLSTQDVWGIGKNLSSQLGSYNIRNAFDLKQAEDTWLKKTFSVVLLRTAWELRGIECLTYGEESARQSITSSRSFGRSVTELHELEEALSVYTANAAVKLRRDGSLASCLCIFLMTSPFREKSYRDHASLTLSQPSSYTPLLVDHAKRALKQIYRPGYLYKKVGVTLLGIVPEGCFQTDFFGAQKAPCDKHTKAMKALDAIHKSMGKESLRFASEGTDQPWKPQKQQCSPQYTTSWDDLLTIQIS